MTFVYVPAMKKAFFWDPAVLEAWLYDPQKNTWQNTWSERLNPKARCPSGVDKVACLDPKRGRIYMGGPKDLWCYDLKANAFVDLQPKGKPPQNVDGYLFGPFSTARSVMNYDTANDVAVVCYRPQLDPRDASRKGGGVYVYDPAANAWGEAPRMLHPEFRKCASSFYDPELNALCSLCRRQR
jgi:hypothetical protein